MYLYVLWIVLWRKATIGQLNKQNSLLCISVDQGLVGEHEASVGTEQQSVANIRNWRGFSGPPIKCTHRSTIII